MAKLGLRAEGPTKLFQHTSQYVLHRDRVAVVLLPRCRLWRLRTRWPTMLQLLVPQLLMVTDLVQLLIVTDLVQNCDVCHIMTA